MNTIAVVCKNRTMWKEFQQTNNGEYWVHKNNESFTEDERYIPVYLDDPSSADRLRSVHLVEVIIYKCPEFYVFQMLVMRFVQNRINMRTIA